MIDKKTHRHTIYMLIKGIFWLSYAQNIAFKWWTAAYFLHGLDRFSTDIDLDYRWFDESGDIYTDIATIASKYWTVKGGKHMIVSYKSWFDSIKIDISRKIWKHNRYETINFYGTDIIVQTRDTIVANKLVRFMERWLNRDIYDMWYFMNQWFGCNEALITERTWLSMDKFWKELEKKIRALWVNYNILDWLWEVLDEKQKVFVKNKLIGELVNLIMFQSDFDKKM